MLENVGERGLSSARNTAVTAASGDLLAFLDDDAVADEKWLETPRRAVRRPDVVGAGGTATPRWDTRRPDWFPPEFDWVVGCTHEGMPLARTDVRNVIGCNMMFRRVALDRTSGFATSLGRLGSVPLGCEETELCIRLRQLDPTARVVFEPQARVRHHVTPERTRFRYFVARNRAEGMSKSVVASLVGAEAGMATERDYLRRILLAAIGRGVRQTLAGRLDGARRAGAIVVGLVAFAAGFAQAELTRRLGRWAVGHERHRRRGRIARLPRTPWAAPDHRRDRDPGSCRCAVPLSAVDLLLRLSRLRRDRRRQRAE